MSTRKPEPVTPKDHPANRGPYIVQTWTAAELAWIAKRDAQWAAWGYSLAPITPPPPYRPLRALHQAALIACGLVLGGLVTLEALLR